MTVVAPSLVHRIAERGVLEAAWTAILDSDREDGALAVGVARFAGSSDLIGLRASDLRRRVG